MSDVETHKIGEKRLIVFRSNYINSLDEIRKIVGEADPSNETFVIVLRPGEKVEFLNEDRMREMGWQPCLSQGEHEKWTLTLDRYERDNLLSVFALGGCLVSGVSVPPFTMLDSGDWFGQIPQKLVSEQEWRQLGEGKDFIQPNVPVETMRGQVAMWIAQVVINMHKDKKLMAELPALAEKFEAAESYIGIGKYNALKEIADKLKPFIEKK